MFKTLTPCTFTIGLYLWKVNRKVELMYSSASASLFFLILLDPFLSDFSHNTMLCSDWFHTEFSCLLGYDVIFIVALFFFSLSAEVHRLCTLVQQETLRSREHFDPCCQYDQHMTTEQSVLCTVSVKGSEEQIAFRIKCFLHVKLLK